MIDLPPSPLKASEIDETHPFVVNAYKERKHYEKCWCGSGLQFKKCHRLKSKKKPQKSYQISKASKNTFWKRRGCMHPQASPERCKGEVINSHTIQKQGPLKKLVKDGHVWTFNNTIPPLSGTNARKISWKKASTFPGYCSYHDSLLFKPIETEKFTGKHRHCVLHAFRNICNALYKKIAQVEAYECIRKIGDDGRDLDGQISFQYAMGENIKNEKKSIEELKSLKSEFNTAITSNNVGIFESRYYPFRGKLSLVSSSASHCEYDFTGKKLVDMWDLTYDAQILSHSVIDTDDGGGIIFVWLKGEKNPEEVVNSFDSISNNDKGDIFVQYCFLNCEDVYFTEDWWSSLGTQMQERITKYADATYYDGGSYTANKEKLVTWEFIVNQT